jgi:hypothetical protein
MHENICFTFRFKHVTVLKTEITAVGHPPRYIPLSAKGGTNFADKRRSLGQLLRIEGATWSAGRIHMVVLSDF